METMMELDLVVTDIRLETPQVKTFEIRRTDGGRLPAFTPGSHIRIQTPNGLVRKYSLTNSAEETHRYLIAVKREEQGRGGSKSLWEDLRMGAPVRISEPSNAFALVEKAKSLIFIAGGIGITPILSMIRSMGELPIAPWTLYYLSPSLEQTAFLQELTSGQYPGKVVVHHTDGKPNNRFDLWPVLEKENTGHVYCCGSNSLMEAVRDMTGHWSHAHIHFESFYDAVVARPDDVPFQVKCAKAHIDIEVPVGKSILEVLLEQGVAVPFSCESGTCGTCKTDLLAGAADHRDFVLLPEERSHKIMLCVSRAKSASIELAL